MMLKPGVAEDQLGADVEASVLRLRELLVRCDENMKAWHLLNAVPYWCWDRPALAQARVEQREMVLHAINPDAYETYYADNPHEQPFEEQTGLTIETADEIPRVKFLRDRLQELEVEQVMDLSANDGWMLAHLKLHGIGGYGLDLNQDAVERAKGRGVALNRRDFRMKQGAGTWPAVVLFETLEHLPDPTGGIFAAVQYVKPGGRLFVSTPHGAMEGGDLPSWAHVERKGHLWSLMPEDLAGVLAGVSTDVQLHALPDRTMIGEAVIAG